MNEKPQTPKTPPPQKKTPQKPDKQSSWYLTVIDVGYNGVGATLTSATRGSGSRAVEPVGERTGVQGNRPGDSGEGHAAHGIVLTPDKNPATPRRSSKNNDDSRKKLFLMMKYILQVHIVTEFSQHPV